VVNKKISPATIRIFGGKRYYVLTKEIEKGRASAIAKSYRKTGSGSGARVAKTANGYTVYVRSR